MTARPAIRELPWRSTCPCTCHPAGRLHLPSCCQPDPVTEGEWVFDLSLTRPLSLNDFHGHRIVQAKAVKAVRQEVAVRARAAGIPRCARIRAVLHYAPRDARRRDRNNLFATVKPLEDGLVDAGVVPDDTETWVEPNVPVIDAPTRARTGRLYVVVTALPPLPGTAEQPLLL